MPRHLFDDPLFHSAFSGSPLGPGPQAPIAELCLHQPAPCTGSNNSCNSAAGAAHSSSRGLPVKWWNMQAQGLNESAANITVTCHRAYRPSHTHGVVVLMLYIRYSKSTSCVHTSYLPTEEHDETPQENRHLSTLPQRKCSDDSSMLDLPRRMQDIPYICAPLSPCS